MALRLGDQRYPAGSHPALGSAEFLLVNKNPAVKASVPQHAVFDAYADIAFPGGIRLSWFTKGWNQGNQMLDRDDVQQLFHDAPWWARPFLHGVKAVDEDRDRSLLKQAVQEHGTNGDIDAVLSQVTFRDDVSSLAGVATDASSPFTYSRDIEASGATVYSWSGWFDGGCPDCAIKRFRTLKNRGRLILGPWNHGASQDASPYSPASPSAFNKNAELLRFFDDQLKGVNTGILQEKPVLYFTMGKERWKTADSWPPVDAHSMSYYFDADHRLGTGRPSAQDASDHYAVDNTTGTGNTSRWNSLADVDVIYPDRSSADQKLLCYTSPPLDMDTEVTGYPVLALEVSSTATDGEFFAYLEDVDAKPKVTYVTEGELRALHRKLSTEPPPYNQVTPYHSFKRADAMPLVPGEVAELVFALQPTSYVFKRGHAIRVALAGADKDHFAVLPGPVPTWDVQRNATYASHMDLPVMLH